MSEVVTIMDVYQLYNFYVNIFDFFKAFGIELPLQAIFMAKIEAVGQAYCEENNLPFPLPKDQVLESFSGPLENIILGPKATEAFRDLEKTFNEVFGKPS